MRSTFVAATLGGLLLAQTGPLADEPATQPTKTQGKTIAPSLAPLVAVCGLTEQQQNRVIDWLTQIRTETDREMEVGLTVTPWRDSEGQNQGYQLLIRPSHPQPSPPEQELVRVNARLQEK